MRLVNDRSISIGRDGLHLHVFVPDQPAIGSAQSQNGVPKIRNDYGHLGPKRRGHCERSFLHCWEGGSRKRHGRRHFVSPGLAQGVQGSRRLEPGLALPRYDFGESIRNVANEVPETASISAPAIENAALLYE